MWWRLAWFSLKGKASTRSRKRAALLRHPVSQLQPTSRSVQHSRVIRAPVRDLVPLLWNAAATVLVQLERHARDPRSEEEERLPKPVRVRVPPAYPCTKVTCNTTTLA